MLHADGQTEIHMLYLLDVSMYVFFSKSPNLKQTSHKLLSYITFGSKCSLCLVIPLIHVCFLISLSI